MSFWKHPIEKHLGKSRTSWSTNFLSSTLRFFSWSQELARELHIQGYAWQAGSFAMIALKSLGSHCSASCWIGRTEAIGVDNPLGAVTPHQGDCPGARTAFLVFHPQACLLPWHLPTHHQIGGAGPGEGASPFPFSASWCRSSRHRVCCWMPGRDTRGCLGPFPVASKTCFQVLSWKQSAPLATRCLKMYLLQLQRKQ